jgi:hypothetical protein
MGDEAQTFELRLGNQQAVKWIVMIARQSSTAVLVPAVAVDDRSSATRDIQACPPERSRALSPERCGHLLGERCIEISLETDLALETARPTRCAGYWHELRYGFAMTSNDDGLPGLDEGKKP